MAHELIHAYDNLVTGTGHARPLGESRAMRVENMIAYGFRTMVPGYGPGEDDEQLNPRWGYHPDNTNFLTGRPYRLINLSWRRWATNPAFLPEY